ncbi:hypothetical protein PEM37_39360, partial [Streptomyces sp. AD681]|uniref:hypothetical protein n=1 Tax=Streptomyces sp. AD681 TaxID=3019069 RepID=UPI0022F1BC8A
DQVPDRPGWHGRAGTRSAPPGSVTDAIVILVDEDTGVALRTWPNSVDLPFFPAAVTDQADGPPFRDAG